MALGWGVIKRGVMKRGVMKRVPARRRELHGGGVVKLERVRVICPACGQQVEAIARDSRVKGYCAVANQSVDFLTARDSKGHFVKGYVPWNKSQGNKEGHPSFPVTLSD